MVQEIATCWAKGGVLAVLILLAASGFASSEIDGGAEEKVLEEIIVTATRRETGVQTTAASISAFSGEQLEELGKVSVAQFIDSVPGVTSAARGPGVNRIIIRNIATSTQESGSPTTTTYFDDFPLSSIQGGSAEIRLVDMERVEVLKGPQGTLYGRSAMGGIVRYISNKPTAEKIAGGVSTYLSNSKDGGSNYGGHGYLNLPITENLAIRAVGYTYQNDGFIDQVELGVKNFNDEDTKGGRLALRWDVTDEFSIDLTYVSQTVDGPQGNATTTRDPGFLDVGGDEGPDIPFDVDARTAIAGVLEGRTTDQELLNLNMEYDFDSFTATLLATKTKEEYDFRFDNREFVLSRFGCECEFREPGESNLDGHSTIQEVEVVELRLVSSRDGLFDWIVGVYYEESERKNHTQIRHLGPDSTAFGFIPLFEGQGFSFDFERTNTGEEKAVYGEIGLNLSSAARLNLGYRRSDIEIGQISTRVDGFFTVFNGDAALEGILFETQEDINTYKLSLEYNFSEDIFGYALASSGYRRGGFNPSTVISPFSVYDSDTLWNYELGLKTTWLDGRLVANVSTYLLKYDDIQLVVLDPVTFAQPTQNVGKADINGIELGLQWLVSENLRLDFSVSVSDPELKTDILVADNPPVFSGRKGDKLPGSATESFSFSARYDKSFSHSLDFFANVFYRYSGSRLNDFNLDLDVKTPSYSFTDLRLGVGHTNGWSAVLFVDNVFDEAAIYHIGRQGPFFESVPTNRPRTVGLNLIYTYR